MGGSLTPSPAPSSGRRLDVQLRGNQAEKESISPPPFMSLFKMRKMALSKERERRGNASMRPPRGSGPVGTASASFLCVMKDASLLTAATFAGGSD